MGIDPTLNDLAHIIAGKLHGHAITSDGHFMLLKAASVTEDGSEIRLTAITDFNFTVVGENEQRFRLVITPFDQTPPADDAEAVEQ